MKNKKKRTAKELIDDNIKIIKDIMKSKKYRGNPKNYVILAGTMLMDYKGSYAITRNEIDTPDKNKKGELLLVHKKHLDRFISEAEAKLFWNKKYNMRMVRHVEKLSARS